MFLVSCLGLAGFPITPTFIGEDVIFSHIHEDQPILALFVALSLIIDGLAIINSSQGGGGVFIHGWGHNLEVANNRISANHGTLAGAINLGNGETPPVFFNVVAATSCDLKSEFRGYLSDKPRAVMIASSQRFSRL